MISIGKWVLPYHRFQRYGIALKILHLMAKLVSTKCHELMFIKHILTWCLRSVMSWPRPRDTSVHRMDKVPALTDLVQRRHMQPGATENWTHLTREGTLFQSLSYSKRPFGKKMKTISITKKSFCNFSVLQHVQKHVFQKTSLSVANEHISNHMTKMDISKHDQKWGDMLLSTWVSIWPIHPIFEKTM